eukprot:364980-Chlamydomonas_euryale.AAC.16
MQENVLQKAQLSCVAASQFGRNGDRDRWEKGVEWGGGGGWRNTCQWLQLRVVRMAACTGAWRARVATIFLIATTTSIDTTNTIKEPLLPRPPPPALKHKPLPAQSAAAPLACRVRHSRRPRPGRPAPRCHPCPVHCFSRARRARNGARGLLMGQLAQPAAHNAAAGSEWHMCMHVSCMLVLCM